jgi:chemotaxis protein MotB
MAEEGLRPIIVKRVKKSGGGAHGGAWKIAYADFVTAMMAFFLLMWLLGSTAKGDLKGIAEYFATPLKVAMSGGTSSGDRSSVIKGGGRDLTRTEGQQNRSANLTQNKTFDLKKARVDSTLDLKKAQAELERQDAERLEALKARIEEAIETIPSLRQYKNQLLIDITTEGLRIQIVDEKNRPMFALAKAELQPYTREILHELAKLLNDIPNRISLSGHTDATPYSNGEKSYSNWELSADRANAARRALVVGGMDESKILRVVGLASAIPFDAANPFNPVNRRISIIVMNKKTEEAITKENRKEVTQDELTNAVQQATAQGATADVAVPATAPAAAPNAAIPNAATANAATQNAAAPVKSAPAASLSAARPAVVQ